MFHLTAEEMANLKSQFAISREMLSSHGDLFRKLDALKRKYDARVRMVFTTIRGMMKPSGTPCRRIGFWKDNFLLEQRIAGEGKSYLSVMLFLGMLS